MTNICQKPHPKCMKRLRSFGCSRIQENWPWNYQWFRRWIRWSRALCWKWKIVWFGGKWTQWAECIVHRKHWGYLHTCIYLFIHEDPSTQPDSRLASPSISPNTARKITKKITVDQLLQIKSDRKNGFEFSSKFSRMLPIMGPHRSGKIKSAFKCCQLPSLMPIASAAHLPHLLYLKKGQKNY